MGVSLGSQGGGARKKPLDAELNLIPFIDLLICCVCFLLITAVWTQLAQIPAGHRRPVEAAVERRAPQVKLTLVVGEAGYTLVAGSQRLEIARMGAVYDTARLGRQLRQLRRRMPQLRSLTVAVEDGISYSQLVRAMDTARQARFGELEVTDSGAHL
jgi:biopolymer transport protein ExbD